MIVDALRKKYEYEIVAAKANIDVYLRNSAGIGEHPDIVEEIVKQLKIVAENQDVKDNLEKHFGSDRVKLDG